MVISALMSAIQSRIPDKADQCMQSCPWQTQQPSDITAKKRVVVRSHSLLVEWAGLKGTNLEVEGSEVESSDFWVRWGEEWGWKCEQSLMASE